jgi:hypothetical protein
MKGQIIAMLTLCAFTICVAANAAVNDEAAQASSLEEKAIPLPRGSKERLDLIAQAAEHLQKAIDGGADKNACLDAGANLAQLYQDEEKAADSIHWSEIVVKLEPNDWRSWAKIAQNAQTLGDKSKRDAAREKVIELNKQHLVDQKVFCREQFKVGGESVMALEYFEPAQPNNVQLSFVVVKDGKIATRYALGETEADTSFARESKQIGPSDHIYSLDGYAGNKEWLVSMFKPTFPDYEKARASVVGDMNRLQQPNPKPPMAGQTH